MYSQNFLKTFSIYKTYKITIVVSKFHKKLRDRVFFECDVGIFSVNKNFDESGLVKVRNYSKLKRTSISEDKSTKAEKCQEVQVLDLTTILLFSVRRVDFIRYVLAKFLIIFATFSSIFDISF